LVEEPAYVLHVWEAQGSHVGAETGFSWLYSAPPSKFQNIPYVRSSPLSSTSFAINYSLIILLFNAIV
jgi:hypothetical protein